MYESQILAGPLQGIITVIVLMMQYEFYGHSRVFSVTLNGPFQIKALLLSYLTGSLRLSLLYPQDLLFRFRVF